MAFFETLALISLIISLVANTAVTVYIVYLTFKDVVNWFRNRQSQINKRNIAFTLQQMMNSGQFKTVQGIFNTDSNSVEEARSVHSNSIDSQMADAHRYHELVTYN